MSKFTPLEIAIANLVAASREAGWCRGKGINDEQANRNEDRALDELKAELASSVEQAKDGNP